MGLIRAAGNYAVNSYCKICYDSIYQAIAKIKRSTKFAQGCGIDSVTQSQLDEAVSLAASVDHVLLVLGLDQSLEGEQHDRYNISLPEAQMRLVRAVRAVNTNVSVILVHGGAIALEEIKQTVPAILDAHYPGQVGGSAVADTIFGRNNPGGKLTYSVYPAVYQEMVNFTHMSMVTIVGARSPHMAHTDLPCRQQPLAVRIATTVVQLRYGSSDMV